MLGRTWGQSPGQLALGALILLLVAAELANLVATDFHPTYLLDDTWIHLQFSEQLARGHFGLVPGEKASPSSSILYPLLLMPLAGTSLHQWQPALWNLAALVAVLLLWLRLFERHVLENDGARTLSAALLSLAAIIFTNTLWLAFTGMEHVLQIAATLAVAIGLLEVQRQGGARWLLLAGLVLGPWLRIENFSITLPALVFLAWRGYWRLALLGLLGSVGGVLVHGWISVASGLPFLGGPLLLKGWLDDFARAPLATLRWEIEYLARSLRAGRPDIGSLVLAAPLAATAFWHACRRDATSAGLSLIALASLLGQFILGGTVRPGRHEIYAQCFALAALAHALREPLQAVVRGMGAWPTTIAAALLLAAIFPANVVWTATMPWAAQDIWRQQWQMRRFLLEQVRAPAAVNDVGLVAYRNPHMVLDLVGLGSEEMRRASVEQRADAAFIARMLAAHRIEAVLVYDHWFAGRLPEGLERVAEFQLGRFAIATGGPVVAVYGAGPEAAARMRAAAAAFAPSMPPGSRLVVVPPR